MPQSAPAPRWTRIALALLALLALARALLLVQHEPLLAYANSYDQIRYTACLDLAPWRPGVAAEQGSPAAPFSRFAFQPIVNAQCVWTSDLFVTAPVAWVWRLSEAWNGRPIHSVRRLAEWRLLCWIAVACWLTRVLLREGRADLALAHLAWIALVAMDPVNTLYYATFYAEAAALFGLYVCGAGVVAALLRPTRSALMVTAIGALILATSKFQHLILPVLIGAAVLLGAGRSGRRVALALILAGLVGFGVQVANGSRANATSNAITRVNRADFVLLVLLEETSDRDRVIRALDLNPTCVAFVGKSIYAMPGPVEQTCTTVDHWSRAQLGWLLLSDPPALARALLHIPRVLLPWQPGYLGVVEGEDHGKLPASSPSLGAFFGRTSVMAALLLVLPWLVTIGCVLRRAAPQARGFALACAAASSGVAVVALFGDGDVEFAKHAQLTINLALASLCVPCAALMRRWMKETHA